MSTLTKELISKLPRRYGAPRIIAENLNNKGVKTKYGRKYTTPNVINALKGEHTDNAVVEELIAIVNEFKKSQTETEKRIKKALS